MVPQPRELRHAHPITPARFKWVIEANNGAKEIMSSFFAHTIELALTWLGPVACGMVPWIRREPSDQRVSRLMVDF